MKPLVDGKSERILIRTTAGAMLTLLLWAHWAKLDQITRGQGQVIASSRNQIIQVSEGGVLVELTVQEGSKVHHGQVLARFDKTKSEASYLESASKASALKAAIARLNAEIHGGAPVFPAELNNYPEFKKSQNALFQKRQASYLEESKSLKNSIDLIQQELEMNLPLVESGDVSKSDILRLQRQLLEQQNLIAKLRNKYTQEAQAELTKAEEDLSVVTQVVTQRKEQLELTEVRSPMDGVVRDIRITTIGGVARPGEEIMQVVPVGDSLVIEAKISPSDIAFIKPGLPATIKLTAYDYSIYGTLKGEVIYISVDTLTENTRGDIL